MPVSRTRTWIRFAATAAAFTLIAACAPGSDDDADDDAGDAGTGSGTDVETDPGNLGDVTLVVWDQEVRGGQSEQIDALNEAFEEEYPNITIERVSRSTDDLRTTLRLALSGDDAPDVVQANNSRTEMGQYVGNDLLTPLDDYAEAYGWFERFPESVRALAMYSDDGEVYGEGQLYGLAQMGEIVGAFYNKSKLDELGIDPPETQEEFEAALETAHEAGELPIQFGNLDPFAGIHEYGFVQNQFADAETISNLGFGRPGSTWLSPENVEATETIVSWVDEGYFTEGFAGLDYDEAWQQFADGEGVFLVAGTWLVADLDEAMGGDVGFMLPPAGASGQRLVTGGISIPFSIPANSENQDAAAAYIDFITSADAMETITETGNLPVVDAAEQDVDGLQAEVFDAWARAGEEDLVVPYLDYATPTFFDTLTAAVQDLLGGERSPEEFLDHLESEYLEHVEDQ
ncbi:extracellular solute-binding protein [Actinobacteria bacterium YIM 96077]|uniref:Sugar ABC transporter substrate-binding protein n=1 Tax=Phytoactinopolyspora halophila TaxID=1981511 RepID=A0A329QDA4_9ACTN|nr:extracellular solute-binding protein [Phytoactinopolyspora halophila]AYY14113.1 extracellular solute-binding protein [Actinobacteria bacterium YIM 96077]RAW09951.1 sugar ABC transporter substrate-binding protein [Phytoactinopolyspora halophila]